MWKQLSFLSNENKCIFHCTLVSHSGNFLFLTVRSICNFTSLPPPSACKSDISEKRVLKCTHASVSLKFWLEYMSALGKHKLTLLGTMMLKGVHWRLGTHFLSSLSETIKNFKWHLKIFNFHYHVFMEDLWNLSTLPLCSPHAIVFSALNYCLDFLIKTKLSKVSCSPSIRGSACLTFWPPCEPQTFLKQAFPSRSDSTA